VAEPRLCPGFGTAEGKCGTRLKDYCEPCQSLLNERARTLLGAIDNLWRLDRDGAGPWAATTAEMLSAELRRLTEGA
jgi:hypothetical protein